jgi:hypothetical protein
MESPAIAITITQAFDSILRGSEILPAFVFASYAAFGAALYQLALFGNLKSDSAVKTSHHPTS